MGGLDPDTLYDLGIVRHREVLARGEARHLRASPVGARRLRRLIAAALLVLAQHLDPFLRAGQGAELTPLALSDTALAAASATNDGLA